MERLTRRNQDGAAALNCSENKAIDRLAAYEDTGLTLEEVKDMMTDWVVWKQAEAGGRLIVLPCKVGDKVYETDGVRVYESTVKSIIFDTENIAFNKDAIGKTVFLTREEAEAALAREADSGT